MDEIWRARSVQCISVFMHFLFSILFESSGYTVCDRDISDYVLCGNTNIDEEGCLERGCCWDYSISLCYHGNSTMYKDSDCVFVKIFSQDEGYTVMCRPSPTYTAVTSEAQCLPTACASYSQGRTNVINLEPDVSCSLRLCEENINGSLSLQLGSGDKDVWVNVPDFCNSVPCENNGTCIKTNNSFICLCSSGFTGHYCTSDVDECESNPCESHSTCVNEVNKFSCLCAQGFAGLICDINIDDCTEDICFNGGSCIDKINGYECGCVTGFTGQHCETDIDNCELNLCSNGATCVDGVNYYTCHCLHGYTGSFCQSEIQYCDSNPCAHDGTCVESNEGFECLCVQGTIGQQCETDIDDCEVNLCEEASTLTCIDEINSYTCQCEDGYTGAFCETDIDDCEVNLCEEASTLYCIDEINSYTCQCKDGYTGAFCETDIDDCVSFPCENQGLCLDDVSSFTCVCAEGYIGEHCETDYEECESRPCSNDAECVDGINSYTCVCGEGYTGQHCESQLAVINSTGSSNMSDADSQQQDTSDQTNLISSVSLPVAGVVAIAALVTAAAAMYKFIQYKKNKLISPMVNQKSHIAKQMENEILHAPSTPNLSTELAPVEEVQTDTQQPDNTPKNIHKLTPKQPIQVLPANSSHIKPSSKLNLNSSSYVMDPYLMKSVQQKLTLESFFRSRQKKCFTSVESKDSAFEDSFVNRSHSGAVYHGADFVPNY